MYADAVILEQPDWSRRPGRRLVFNLLPASLIVVGALLIVRLPVIEQSLPVTELIVRILVDDVAQVVESPFVEDVVMPEPTPEAASEAVVETIEPATSETQVPTDWYAKIPEAVEAYETSKPREYHINPAFEERRRQAAEQFYPSRAPVERPIWENVEKDTLGRTILVSGNCHRVIDDPNVGSREKFLTFDQFFVFCSNPRRKPQKLGFVDEVKNRREGQVRYGHPAAE
jgi:hypothetical protein